MRRPRAICFDMGYTLLQHAPTGADLYRRVLGAAGHDFPPDRLEAAFAPARDFYIRSTREGRPFESSMELAMEFWSEYNSIVLDHLGVAAEHHDVLGRSIYTEAWSPAAWKPFPEVLPTLAALRRQGFQMAIISNFVDTLGSVCDMHELTPYFDVIVSSVGAGAMKPDPRIFQLALRRLGVAAADAWHVGDNYWADVMGARAAGLSPVLVDRDGSVPRPDCAAIARLDGLLELVNAAASAPGEGDEAAA
ncbi:MAG: hypothetical protein QOE92_1730 [Chloroflexota bacterium]|jgi:HAD superfamily hydrolase (TIGR01509 family)|nr:hypothetical protein [Chloroflexota bacterium]